MFRLGLRFFTTAALLLLVSTTAHAAGSVSFLTGPQSGDPYDIAISYVQSNLGELGLSAEDFAEFEVQDQYQTKHNGVTHIYLQQRLGGIGVYNGVMNINVARDGSIINLHSDFVGNLAGKVNRQAPDLSDINAISRAAEHYGTAISSEELTLLSASGGADLAARYAPAGVSRDEIPVNLVYQPLEDGSVRLAWQTVLNLVDSSDWWNVRIDAENGEILHQNNWTNYDSYLAVQMPPFSDYEDAGGQTTITDPADPIASPFGWHDTDGSPGAESTETRGNNVNAQDDLDANNSGGLSPDGGPGLDFAFPFDPALQPTGGTNLEAAIVNLFYTNNVMHDITYHYGFDEAAGNFQSNNYGNGGIGGDQVEADAQDGTGTNNATFSTPPDGGSGRMHMFVWIDGGPLINGQVTENSPTPQSFQAGRGDWGDTLDEATTADLEEVDDGSGAGTSTHGCNALVGFTPGNIALIDRGSCEFGTKALNAETAGAIGAIIVNDDQQGPNGILSMGAGVDGGSVTIPAVMIGPADGTTLRNEASPNVTLECPDGGCPVPNPINRDSDFDNGIVGHEFGHGVSNRLTGGPSSVGCLSGSEQQGEGWSDFWTLVLSAKSTDTPELAKGVGNYVIFEPVNGPGIRNFPYSTDLGISPQTYGDIGDTNVPHGVGEIWMNMLWEMYWELVHKHGFDGDFYTGSGGNNLTIQLVMDGMKLQGCNPDFVVSRDAILAADAANNGGENECEIWRAFAKRGAGVSAVPGSINAGDETEAFDIPGHCDAESDVLFVDGFEAGDTERWTTTSG